MTDMKKVFFDEEYRPEKPVTFLYMSHIVPYASIFLHSSCYCFIAF